MRLYQETARELAYCSVGDEYAGFKVVHNELVDTTRWNTVHLLIIERVGELGFWGCHYQQGATEYQSDGPFEDEVPEFVPYYPKAVQTIKWMKRERTND